MSKHLTETLILIFLVCVGVKVAAEFISAALPALIPVFIMAVVVIIILRWRSHL